MEDSKNVDQAKRANEARRTLKDFKNRHGADLHKGTDARSHSTMIDKKKQKFLQKQRENLQKEKAERPKGQGRSFGDKAMSKIVAASRPTRSKMIIRSGGGGKKKGRK